MSWASFVTNIQWFKTGDTWAGPPAAPLSDTDKTKILNTLQLLYNSSPTAQAVMERSIAKPLHLGGIDPANINPGLSSKSGDFSLFNISKLEQFHYFNKQGFYVLEKLGLSLIHELIHSVDDKDDLINSPPSESDLNQPNYDQAGQVLPIQNQIAQEMGWTSNFQVSYQGAFSPGEAMASDLQEGVSYTENNIVDTVRIGALTNNNNTGVADNLDHSRNTTHVNDLFLAWDGADAVYGGAGNDYIYGGRGEDRLFGGTGNDLLHGGDLTLVEAQDGYDVADYSKVSSIQSATGGIVANFDYAAQNLYLGSRYVVVENDGTGGVDRLVSIEKVVGTSFLDTFKIKGSLDAQLSLLVDGTLGGDIVDATASNAAYSFVSRGASGLNVEDKGSGGTIKFKNIDGEIKGGAGADYFAIKDLKVHGGDGADYIIVAGTEVFGDGGGDKIELNNSSPEATVTGGAGNDAYIINAPAGRATLLFGAGDGHDVVVSYTDNSVLIDFGNVSLSSLSVLWNRKYVSSSSGSIEWGDGTIPVGSDHYNGKAAIALPTGDTIAIGDIEGSFSWTGNNPAAWEQIRFLGEFRVRGAEGEVNFEQLARMTGLLEPNKSIGKVLPALSAASNHSADSQWAAAYFSGQSTPTTSSSPGSPLGATAGNDTFMGNEFSHTVSYSAATAAVSVDLGIYGRQQTNGSGLDQLIGVTDIVGSAFGDVLQAADVGSSLAGGGGNDTLRGGAGYDYLDGGDGDDSLWAAGYFDWIDGGAGYDTLVLGGARENFTFQWQADGSIWIVDASGEEGEDGLVNVEAVWFDTPSLWQSITDVAGEFGSEASELVTGSLYADWLWGLGEDDELYGRAGDDRLDGGDGYDQAVYDGASTNFVALRNADGTISVQAIVGGEGHDTLINIEAVYFRGDEAWTSIEDLVGYYGTSGNDTWVAGTARADNLYGLEGDDELIGFEGDDHLFGGDGDDQANFYGLSTNYTFTLNPDGTVTATDTTGAEGVDMLDSIEYVYFVEDEVWTTVADLLGSSARGSSAARASVLATADSDAFDAADFAPLATTAPVVANEAWFA